MMPADGMRAAAKTETSARSDWQLAVDATRVSTLPQCPLVQPKADVPLFVEHCEAVAAEIDVKLRWLGEQARRGLSVWSDALPVRHVMLEVAYEPSVVGSL